MLSNGTILYLVVSFLTGWGAYITRKLFQLEKDKMSKLELKEAILDKTAVSEAMQGVIREDMQEIKADVSKLQDKLDRIIELHSKSSD